MSVSRTSPQRSIASQHRRGFRVGLNGLEKTKATAKSVLHRVKKCTGIASSKKPVVQHQSLRKLVEEYKKALKKDPEAKLVLDEEGDIMEGLERIPVSDSDIEAEKGGLRQELGLARYEHLIDVLKETCKDHSDTLNTITPIEKKIEDVILGMQSKEKAKHPALLRVQKAGKKVKVLFNSQKKLKKLALSKKHTVSKIKSSGFKLRDGLDKYILKTYKEIDVKEMRSRFMKAYELYDKNRERGSLEKIIDVVKGYIGIKEPDPIVPVISDDEMGDFIEFLNGIDVIESVKIEGDEVFGKAVSQKNTYSLEIKYVEAFLQKHTLQGAINIFTSYIFNASIIRSELYQHSKVVKPV